jgi:DNA-binding NarL/FixJ family response regulator
MVRVVLVDDHATVRRLLRELIEDDGRFQLVGEAENGREAIETAKRLQPDAVILDQEMPEMTGTEALPQLVSIVPKVVVVMFSSGPRPETELIATAAGADAYFEKTDPVPDLLDAVVDLVAAQAGS